MVVPSSRYQKRISDEERKRGSDIISSPYVNSDVSNIEFDSRVFPYSAPKKICWQLTVFSTTIYLHRPRSKLLYNNAENISKCALPPPPRRLTHAAQEAYQMHTVMVLTAAERISSLLALPTPLVKQSQFIICMVALSAIAQLSACIFDTNIGTSRAIKERIRVNIGALKAHEKIWPLSRKTLYEVKSIAREVFALQKLDSQAISDLVADAGEFPSHTGNSMMVDESFSTTVFGDSCCASPIPFSNSAPGQV